MSLTYVGSLSLGPVMPTSVSAVANLTASLGVEITGFAALVAGIGVSPPSISASISTLVTLTASLNIAIALVPPLPYVDAQVIAIADAIAELEAQLVPVLALELLLNGGAGIFSYAFNGKGSIFGSSIENELSASWPDGSVTSGSCTAIILATVTSSLWTDMLSLFAIPPVLPVGLTYLAEYNLGSLNPSLVDATFGITASLKAQLNGLIKLAANIAIHIPSLSSNLSFVADMTATLTAALSVTLPGLSATLAAIASAVAAITANLSLLAALTVAFGGAAGVFCYTYTGPADALGAAVTASISGGWPDSTPLTAQANALVLGTTQSAVAVEMLAFFGGL